MTSQSVTKTTTSSLLASKVQLSNILQFTLTQTTLQSNFQAIIEAITDHDKSINDTKQNIENNKQKIRQLGIAQDNTSKQVKELRDLMNKIMEENRSQKEIKEKDNKISIHSNNQSIQQMKLQKVNPEHIQLQKPTDLLDLRKQIQILKDKQSNNQAKLEKIQSNFISQIEKLKKEIGQISNNNTNLLNLEKKIKDLEMLTKNHSDSINEIEKKLLDLNGKKGQNHIEKLISEMDKKLNEFIEATYKPNHEKIQLRISQLEKISSQTKNGVEEEKKQRNKLGQQVWKIHDSVTKLTEQNFANQINADMIKQIKKQIGDLTKKINELNSLYSKFNFNESTRQQSPNKFRNTTDLESVSPTKYEGNGNMELKEDMIQRMKTLKAELMRNIKKYDAKNQNDLKEDKKKFETIGDSILRIEHILADKANLDSVKKLISIVENKISYIYNIFFAGKNEEDACIARKNWICLSCDKKLDKYQGKIGQHLVSAQLKAKAYDQQTLGGGMNLKPTKSRLDLPGVMNKSSKKL